VSKLNSVGTSDCMTIQVPVAAGEADSVPVNFEAVVDTMV
jgi:hypothetical protein